MRNGGGKQKGASFERDVCRHLSLWVSSGTQEDVFWRSAMSGGRATVGQRRGKLHAAQAGDISAVHEIGMFFIGLFMVECKAYKNLDFIGLLKDTGKLYQFWAKAKAEATRYGKFPLLIAKQNQQPVMACLDSDGMLRLGISMRHVKVSVHKCELYLVPFDTFIAEAKIPVP